MPTPDDDQFYNFLYQFTGTTGVYWDAFDDADSGTIGGGRRLPAPVPILISDILIIVQNGGVSFTGIEIRDGVTGTTLWASGPFGSVIVNQVFTFSPNLQIPAGETFAFFTNTVSASYASMIAQVRWRATP